MKEFNKFGFKVGAEIGVDRGTFSRVICESIPGVKLYCIDPWSVEGEQKYHSDSRYETTKQRLAPYDCTIIKETSMDASYAFEDESLDFVYIDGDHHFDYVMEDLILWARKVRNGGIIAGHDYYRFRQAGVIEAVDVYTKMHGVEQWFLTDYLKDKTPSFFWVKQPDRWNK